MTTTPFQGMMASSVHVKDIERARKFYTGVLGFREQMFNREGKAAYFEVPGSNVTFVVHEYGGECAKNGGRPPGTVSGIVFAVPEVRRGVEELQKRGVTITDPALYGGTMASFADPDGNEFTIGTK